MGTLSTGKWAAVLCAVGSLLGGEAEIQDLVRRLAGPDPAEQEAAVARLGEIGLPVGESLAPLLFNQDPEVRRRARDVLERMGWVSPQARQRASEIARLMRETRNPSEGARALVELRRTGRAGLEAWLELFPARRLAERDLSIEARFPAGKRSFGPGEAFRIEAVIANASSSAIWVSTYAAGPFPMVRRAMGSGKERIGNPVSYLSEEAVVAGDEVVSVFSDLYDLVCLRPGESVTVVVDCEVPSRPGLYVLEGRYRAKAEADRERVRERLARAGPVAYAESEDLLRGCPDLLSRVYGWGEIEVRER